MSRILRVHNADVTFDFDYDKVSSYHYEEQRDSRIAFVVKMIDEDKRHLFYNNSNLEIQLVEKEN